MKKKKSGGKRIGSFMTAVFLAGVLGTWQGDAAQASQTEPEAVSGNSAEEETVSELPELAHLQIPVKMDIVIDPWEMDEREQIYSEEYTVQNAGETPGILVLEFSCRVREDAGLSFWENQNGLHDSGEKRIYMKVLFGTGEEAVFFSEGAKYQTQLQPGEKLSLRFTGEVNENAEDPWKDGDLEIVGTYSWTAEDVLPDKAEREEVPETEGETADGNVPSVETAGDTAKETDLPEKADVPEETNLSEKTTAPEAVPPPGNADVPGEADTPEEAASSKKITVPEESEGSKTGEEQVPPSETEQKSDIGNNLPENKTEE